MSWITRRRALALAAAALPAAARAQSTIAEAIASPERFAGDALQDAWRKPEAVLTFMGVAPGMRVLDYLAGGGFNSELLARAVGPRGSVIAYNTERWGQSAAATLAKRFGAGRLANVEVLAAPTDGLKLADGSLDGVLFVMCYHDLYATPPGETRPMGDPAQVNAGLLRALKPGGVVLVVDHAAKPGADRTEAAQTLHRIDPAAARADFERAGFAFDGESDLLRNPQDDRSRRVADPAIRFRTDRFMMRFRKPPAGRRR